MQPLFLRKTMLRISLTVFFLLVSFLYSFTGLGEGASAVPEVKSMAKPDRCAELFREMQLEGEVNYTAFRQAVTGYYRIAQRKKEILTLIDFSKPSTEKRLYVFDMKEKKMLFSSVVAHGKNSGGVYATSFSNEYGSYKSSLGFYLTASTYQGKNGYSLILDGLEKGINDRARERAIVVHGSFRHSCRGEARKKFRMSCRSAKTFPAAYRYYQRRKCDVYLCCYSRVSCTEPYPELQRPCLTTLW